MIYQINPVLHWSRLSREELEKLYDFITAHPGQKISKLARQLNWSYQKLEHRLIALETFQLFLYEDEEGRLYPFRK